MPQAKTTHYIPAFTQRRRGGQVAVCGATVSAREHTVEPSCPACQAWLARDASESATTRVALAEEFPEYRGQLAPAAMTAALERIDAKLVAAVKVKLGTEQVRLVHHRPTGIGSQTVPVFSVPPEFIWKAVELGLEVNGYHPTRGGRVELR